MLTAEEARTQAIVTAIELWEQQVREKVKNGRGCCCFELESQIGDFINRKVMEALKKQGFQFKAQHGYLWIHWDQE